MASKPWEGPQKKYSYIKFKSFDFNVLSKTEKPQFCTPGKGGDNICQKEDKSINFRGYKNGCCLQLSVIDAVRDHNPKYNPSSENGKKTLNGLTNLNAAKKWPLSRSDSTVYICEDKKVIEDKTKLN